MSKGKSTDMQNRREYSRVEVQLPIDVRLVPTEEQPHIRARISGRKAIKETAFLPEVEDRALAEWLKLLNSKLDTIIRTLTLQEEAGDGLPFHSENISGGGMSFTSLNSYAVKDILEIKTMFTLQQSVVFCLYGEVVKTERREQGYLTSVKFVALDEVIRDEIVRFVFEMERELLRKQRG